ncbi:MAG: precorrin-6y C5,15-methyltransferase (decarboxylating) subunit CbiE [Planctomycetota bacterium]|jgi:precorrin-6y C5,15-methyltransferase (decarboxylating) CbiE subunit|nr:precorrin-6y C5,15-methyltransferase (decarboxylating) subunit CbiE [Planctomycetota bacterium]
MGLKIPLSIVGCGPGAREFLTREAERVVSEAEFLAGPERLIRLFADSSARKLPWSGKTDDLIKALCAPMGQGVRVVALVSGDVGAFSLASRLVEAFGKENCRLHPGISSFQLAFARLCVPWENARLVHAHGGDPGVDPAGLSRERQVAVALDAGKGWDWFLRAAPELMNTHDLHLCADLSLEDETVVAVASAADLAAMPPPRLAVAVFLRRGRLPKNRPPPFA